MVMHRASKTSTGESSQTTGTFAARRNSGAPGCAYVPPPSARTMDSFELKDAAEGRSQLIGFDLAKRSLAEALEDFGNPQPRGRLNSIIEVDKAPGQLARQQRADGGLAGAHEAGEAEHLYRGG